MKKKIGIYICHCGGNISDYVDVEKVKASVADAECVFMSKTTLFACSDANQKDMVEDIKTNGLDSVIVASCSPKLHLLTFRNVSERAGLNKYTYVHANIREQASWAHSNDKAGATEKAIQLVKAALAKAEYAKPLIPNKIEAKKAVAVIGGGITGLKAALSIADKNCEVILIEKEPFIGGRTAQWDSLFPTKESGPLLIKNTYEEILKRKNITLYTGAELISQAGSIGQFTIKIKKTPSYISSAITPQEVGKAIALCPVSVPDEFNFGLTERKAIYQNHLGQYPPQTVIDEKNCTRCGECVKASSAINLMQEEEVIELTVGSILMASGFNPYTPKTEEFGYGKLDNVITLAQFNRLLSLNDKKLMYQGKEIKTIAYIYCVGSRQTEGENKYCSRYCCTSTIHAAISAKKKFTHIYNYHFTRGVRSYGKQEILYAESLAQGDIYLQSFEDNLPQVYQEGNKTMVKINDVLSHNQEIETQADLVVLVTGMVPRENNLGSLLKLPKGRDAFFNEIHMKLRPVETVIDGITIAGTCQSSKNISESVNSALAAATKSYSYISKGLLETEPIIAYINESACSWCTSCSQACPFDAIHKKEVNGKWIAEINNSVCKGCGMCTPVCPTDAIDLTSFSSKEMMSMIDALV